MGTRGTYGFRHKETDYLTYNHSDSYPDGLGDDIAKSLREFFTGGGNIDTLRAQVEQMRMIDDESGIPTVEDQERFKDLWSNVSNGKDWYSLLRGLQGDILAHLDAGVMIAGNDFIMDSLFCEWGYIVNLDTGQLEVYKGFQDELHELGRYGGEVPDPEPYPSGHPRDKYYGCALVGTWPIDDLPVGFGEMVTKLAYPEDGEEEAA